MAMLDLLATLAELAWLYIQLYGLRTARWIYANPDGTIGTVCGLAGAFVLAASAKREAWGWLLFLASNAAMIALGQRLDRPDIVILQCGFTITSLLGLWRTAGKPLWQSWIWDEWRGDFDGVPVMLIKYLASWRGWRLDLHQMIAPDAPGCFHTHPAKAVRVVLWGGYTEEIEREQLPCDLQLASSQPWIHVEHRRPGYIGRVKPELCHRIHALPRGVSYSLWLRWPKTHKTQLRGPGWPQGSEAA